MLYAKIIDGSIQKYPYTMDDLRWDNPNTSFPISMSEEELAEWDVYAIKETAEPSHDYKKTTKEGTPVLDEDGSWIQTWEITDLPAHEIYDLHMEQWDVVRTERDLKLTETDWVVIKALESGTPVPPEWVAYRQALRNITEQTDPFDIIWPELPSS